MTQKTNRDRFTLAGREFAFDAERNEVWVLPPVRRRAPKPQPEPSLWQRLVQGVRGIL